MASQWPEMSSGGRSGQRWFGLTWEMKGRGCTRWRVGRMVKLDCSRSVSDRGRSNAAMGNEGRHALGRKTEVDI